jgi:hypothetical protein
MGYTTDFWGKFSFNKKVADKHRDYINAFINTRRMKRNAKVAEKFPDPIRTAVGLPIGTDGGFYVGGGEFKGQEHDASVVEYNSTPYGQPSLWCQWAVSDDGKFLEWDGGEKFYDYVEWLEYIINNFLKPWKYTISGEVTWQGEDNDDRGKIVVDKNKITIMRGRVVYEEDATY